MNIFDILVRAAVAWCAGAFFGMLASMMTSYDGLPSLIALPILVAVMTGISILVLLTLGLPLYARRVWEWWSQHYWMSLVLVSAGVILMVLSWAPFRVTEYDHTAETMIETFHPGLALCGWCALLFGILYCPVISVKKWADRWNAWIAAARREKN